MEWVEIEAPFKLQRLGKLLVWLDKDWPVMIFCKKRQYFALDAYCTHQEEFLTEVDWTCHEAICPLHNAKFDLYTGTVTQGPAAAPLTVYPVREDEAGRVWLGKTKPWWKN